MARTAKVREKERELTMSTDEAYTTLHHEGNDLAGLLGEQKKAKMKEKICRPGQMVRGKGPWAFHSTAHFFLKRGFLYGIQIVLIFAKGGIRQNLAGMKKRTV